MSGDSKELHMTLIMREGKCHVLNHKGNYLGQYETYDELMKALEVIKLSLPKSWK